MQKKGGVPLVHIDVGLLAAQVGVSSTNTLDRRQGVHDVLFAINVRVEHTQNVLELILLFDNESLIRQIRLVSICT